ncbi:MAG: putative Bacterial pre-peptidase C-terminal domain protein [Deltaproteobacteria bacterium]|nr:putative Bacterial pre-peptidase C-terminal domain protein [Deltaproteobacteria bacterium]
MPRCSFGWSRLSAVIVLVLSYALLSFDGLDTHGVLKSSSAEAGQATYPDLMVSGLSTSPASVNAGATIYITDTTRNSGNNTAGASVTQYRLSVDSTITSSDSLIGSRSVGTLKKSSSSTATNIAVTIPSNVTPGPYYIGACADGTGVVTESNETNNCGAITTTVNIIAPISFTANPSVVPAGGTSTATWTQIANPSVSNWIGLYPVGSGSYVNWFYLNCSQFFQPSTPVASGSCLFGISSSLTPGNYELRLNTYTTITSNTIVVNPPEPVSKLAILPVSSHTADSNFYVQVQSQSVSGVPTNVTSNTGVSVSLKTGTGILNGTLTGTIAAGSNQVSVGSMTYTKAESGVVLTASVTSGDALTPGDSAPFTVLPGSPSALAFITQPVSSPAGSVLAGPPTVAVRDSLGNTVTSSTAAITIDIASPSYPGVSGTTVKNASGGIASFTDLIVSPLGNGYSLKATSANLSAVTSSTFNVTTATGTVAGTVSRADNAAPISGALIEAFQAGVSMGSITSAVNGSYSMSGLPTGIYDLRASATGYVTQPKSGIGVTLGSTSTADFGLTQEKIIYVYDSLSRLRAVIDVTGQTATYSYDAVGNLLAITRNNSTQTSVIEFTPSSGPLGTTVTIYGTAFSQTPSQNAVSFNGTSATVISAAPTQIVAWVPAGATTGAIGVTSPSGSASSAASFTVTSSSGSPTVTSFTPGVGTVGTPVTVNGTNFDPTPSKNDLRFNGVARASVGSATPTSIATTVPSGVSSGRISVTTALGKGISGTDFFVPPSGNSASDIEFTGRLGTNGTPLTVVINNAGKKGLIVFDGVAGQRMSLRVTGDTFPWPPSCAACSDVTLQFIRPDGQNWVYTSWGNANTHYYETPRLPISGTYTILFVPHPQSIGQSTLALYHITDEDRGVITPGVPVIASVYITGQNPRYTFNGASGQRISLLASNSNLAMACPWCDAATVSIIKPDGQNLAQTNWANATGGFIDQQTLPISGTYAVVVDPEGYNIGHVTLTLYNVPPDNPGPISGDGTPVVANITVPGQRMSWTFVGAANQVVTVDASNTTFSCGAATMSILKPDSSVLKSQSVCGTQSIAPVILPLGGIYTVLVDGGGTAVGQVTLRLYQWPSLTLSYNGKIRDRVGQGDAALSADGAMDGTLTVTVPSGGGTRTANYLELRNSVNGIWDATPANGYWALGAANSLDGTLLNNADSSVNFSVKPAASFNVFGSDYNNSHFNSGTSFIITVKFTDGSRAAGIVSVP